MRIDGHNPVKRHNKKKVGGKNMDITKFVCPNCGITFFVESGNEVVACPCCEKPVDDLKNQIATYEWED